jgi:hypothetical protein
MKSKHSERKVTASIPWRKQLHGLFENERVRKGRMVSDDPESCHFVPKELRIKKFQNCEDFLVLTMVEFSSRARDRFNHALPCTGAFGVRLNAIANNCFVSFQNSSV